MRKAGCRQICIGFESGSQRLLDEVDRGVKVADMEAVPKMMKDAQIKLHADFIIGLPGENEATLKETFNLMKMVWDRSHPTLTVVLFKPYPGTSSKLDPGTASSSKELHNEFKKIFNYAEICNIRCLTTEPGYVWNRIRTNISSPKKFGSLITKFFKAWFQNYEY
jgi:radical SAM superfamily enzyme YgiQ (UPF0313 family)